MGVNVLMILFYLTQVLTEIVSTSSTVFSPPPPFAYSQSLFLPLSSNVIKEKYNLNCCGKNDCTVLISISDFYPVHNIPQ